MARFGVIAISSWGEIDVLVEHGASSAEEAERLALESLKTFEKGLDVQEVHIIQLVKKLEVQREEVIAYNLKEIL